MSQHPIGRDERFRRICAEHFDALLGYALRRVDRSEDAADIGAETFLVGWRRVDDVPPGAEAKLWLYGVVRRTLANHRRGEGRRSVLGERLRLELGIHAPDPSYVVVERRTVADEMAAGTPATLVRERSDC